MMGFQFVTSKIYKHVDSLWSWAQENLSEAALKEFFDSHRFENQKGRNKEP